MKICFVQPETNYQIKANRFALAQTFPQIICSFGLKPTEYDIYVFGKSTEAFEKFLLKNKITHVLITSITSTFPKAVQIAHIAKEHDIITCIGGIFATMNAKKIYENFKDFDFVLTGHSNHEMLNKICSGHYGIIQGKSEKGQLYSTGNVIASEKFSMYDKGDVICYEITNGCPYSCNYCTIKAAFDTPCLFTMSNDEIKKDLSILSKKWDKLKLIDDDISLAFSYHRNLSFRAFSQVIAEIRVDHIDEQIVKKLSNAGITHLLFGIESFNSEFIRKSKKSLTDNWESRCLKAIEICHKYGITCRPIIMLTNPNAELHHIEYLVTKLKTWVPENKIEALFSFYTPHPGLPIKITKSELISNNLINFDHLHLVYKPPAIQESEIPTLIELYEELVKVTKSEKYNPPITYQKEQYHEYDIFFNDLISNT